ncbi:MAG: phosphoenolpyruvate carboxylase [Mariniphaga sp.]|nr:phosphoenolpyruvate carboxylase [Mariniphaga sp.]
MENLLNEVKVRIGKPYGDLEFLLECFSEVLNENNEIELAAQVPWISGNEPDFSTENTEKLLHLFSISFQLLNLAEVNGAVQNHRSRQGKNGLESVSGMWGNIFSDLKSKGIQEETIAKNLEKVHAEPVLTAHPTEAKRPVVLALYRQLYLLLVKRENSMYTSHEQEEIRQDIKQILHKLWFIGEIFIEKPAVESELENVLYYFYKVFPEMLHYLNYKLKQAWGKAGFNPDLLEDKKVKNEILGLLLTELELTRKTMLDLLGSPSKERRKNHYYSTQLRAEALLPLHRQQVSLLKQWRKAQKSDNNGNHDFLLHNLLRSINVIANALGTTG